MDTTVAGDTLPATAANPPLGPGTSIGRYRIERRIGAGGMGVVFLAFDPELERNVALKLLRDHGDDATADRLRREARALAALSHPNVVAVHDVGDHDGQLFIAMEFVDGGSLRDWIAPLRPWRDVVRALVAAGRGIAAAHAAGLVHRDIKPDNLLVGRDGRVRVTDFGIVASATRAPNPDLQLTVPGALIGTPAYMAPEQLTGSADARSDQFSLCATGFEALFGTRPFIGTTIEGIISAIVQGEIVETRRDVPRWLRAALVRGLASDPEQRWPSVGALCDDLERRQHRPRRWLIAGGLAVAAAGGSAIALAAVPSSTPTCEVARADGVWSTDRADKLATYLPTGTVQLLEAWVRRWSTTSADVCVTDADDSVLRARRQACLDDELARFGNALAVWESGSFRDPLGAEVQIMGLPGAWRCSHAAQATAADPPTRIQAMQIAAVRRMMILGTAKLTVDPAHADISGYAALARAVDYPPFTIESLVDLSKPQLQIGTPGAMKLLREALAIGGSNHLAELDASVPMIAAASTDAASALKYADRARALVHELGAGPEVEAQLDQYVAAMWSATSRHADAAAAYRRASAECKLAFGEDSQCGAMADLGMVTELKASGVASADTAQVWMHASKVLARLGLTLPGDPVAPTVDEIIEADKTMLEVAQRTRPDTIAVADAELNLAHAYSFADRDAEVIPHLMRGIELRDKAGIRDTKLVEALELAANMRIAAGKPREALPIAKRAIDLAREVAEPELAYATMIYGRAMLESGDVTGARAQLEQALAVVDKGAAQPIVRGRTRFYLAQALWPADKQRAVHLAQAARTDLEDVVEHTSGDLGIARVRKRLAEVERWLHDHQ